jgi:hypothetical protein
MSQEPAPGVLYHCFKRPWFCKEVRRAGHDNKFLVAAQLGECSAIES